MKRASYRTVDIVTVAMIGVAVGVVYWGWDKIYGPVSKAALFTYPPSTGLLGGVWLLAGIIAGLIVRKPGAAFMAELVAAVVETTVLGGSQWGWSALVSGVLQGAGAELVLALLRYRRFGPLAAAGAGAVAAVFEAVYDWQTYYPDWAFGAKLAYLGFFAVSGAVIAGYGGGLFVRALARAGVLDSFAAGRLSATEV